MGCQTGKAGPVPSYKCSTCGLFFNRLSGTPFAYRPSLRRGEAWMALLSQPISFKEAARQLGVMDATVRNMVKALRTWLLEVDPSGRYERAVQMGGRLSALQDVALPQMQADVVREDATLTAVLLTDFDRIHSPYWGHPPVCVHCGGRQVKLHAQGKRAGNDVLSRVVKT